MSSQGSSSLGNDISSSTGTSTALVLSSNQQVGSSGGRSISSPSTAPTVSIELFNSIISQDRLPTPEEAQNLYTQERSEYLQLVRDMSLNQRVIITLGEHFKSDTTPPNQTESQQTNKIVSICMSYIAPLALQEFTPEFREHIFSKYEMIQSALKEQLTQIRKTKDISSEVVQHLEARLKLFTLCYLVKGAKIPIFHEKPWDYQANPEEFFGDNKAKYYRSQGGSIIAIYKDILSNSEYGFLFPKKGDVSAPSLELIKGPGFKDVLKMSAPYLEWTSDTPSQVLQDFISGSPKGVVDISKFLNPSGTEPVDPKELEKNIKIARGVVEQHKNILDANGISVVGMFTMNDGQSACLVFNDQHPDNAKLIHGQQHDILHLKEKDGYFPDFIEIRMRVCNHRIGKVALSQFSSVSPNVSPSLVSLTDRVQSYDVNSILNKIDSVIARLNVSSSNTPTHQIAYQELFCNLLVGLKNELEYAVHAKRNIQTTLPSNYSSVSGEPTQVTNIIFEYAKIPSIGVQDIKAIGIVLEKSLNRIALFAQQAQVVVNFNDRFMKYELITEEMILMLEVLDSFGALNIDLLEELNKTGASKSDGINKQTFAFTSGMNAYSQVLRALFNVGGAPLPSVLSSSNYFEVRLDLPGTKRQVLQIDDGSVINFMEFSQSESTKLQKLHPRVVFTDIYPNEVTQPYVRMIDVSAVVSSIINNYTNDEPLNVIIDTSTMHFREAEVNRILTELDKPIKDGILNLVLVGSLAKFSMCGLDKFTGGIVQIYNNSDKFSVFNKSLDTSQRTEPLSRMAQNFFGALFKYAGENIQRYVEDIGICNERLYRELNKLVKGTPMTLALKESNRIPMLGFQFQNFACAILGKQNLDGEDYHFIANLTCLLQYYIYGLTKEGGLPLNMRTSFGFPHSNLNECYTALRLTCGLDVLESSICSTYAGILYRVNGELGVLMSTKGEEQTMMINVLQGKYGKELGTVGEIIKLMRTELLDTIVQETTFVNFVKNFIKLKDKQGL